VPRARAVIARAERRLLLDQARRAGWSAEAAYAVVGSAGRALCGARAAG
jgi:hypothetical protein